jgi:L-phenylalanine/L-methionine N-acetyltransferase
MTPSPSLDSRSLTDASGFTVRRSQEADAPAIAALMNEPRVMRETLQVPHASAEHWLGLIKASQSPLHLQLVVAASDQVVGFGGLYPPGNSPRTQHQRGLAIAVSSSHWGQGVAPLLMRSLLDSADNWLGVSRVQLTVYTDNARAIALYQRHGFEIEGTARRFALRDGVLVDALHMARVQNLN